MLSIKFLIFNLSSRKNKYQIRKKIFSETKALRLEVRDSFFYFKHIPVRLHEKNNRTTVNKFENKGIRCAFPGCRNESAQPKFKCEICDVPLCCSTENCGLKKNCFYYWHTIKKKSTAIKLLTDSDNLHENSSSSESEGSEDETGT